MADESQITETDLADLIRRMDEAARAYIRGDLPGYVAQFDHGDDYTLMPPYGGETRHGFAYSEEAVEQTRSFFRSGEAWLDVQQTYACGDRWQMVHRHADPLVRQIPFDHFAALARGLET